MAKYITAKELKVSCKFEGRETAEIIPLRKGAVIELDESGVYKVVKPTNDYEKRIFLSEATLNGFKGLKAIVSLEARQALKTANTGNNVQLEKKVIDLVSENNELKERVAELEEEVELLNTTLANFTNSAAAQGDGLNSDEEDLPDYESMTVNQLKEIAEENGVEVAGMKKAEIIEALYALHEDSDEE